MLALTALALATPALAAEGFTSVTASGDDGNVPANAIDGDPTTRWSSNGVGEWLTGDLGAVKSLSAVDIGWHRGNERVNNFAISTSTDGTTFTQVHSGSSSGNTAALERYSFSPVSARYVRITVNGSSMNTWASIAEMQPGTGSTPPTDPPGEQGQDKFGVTMIYPTKSGGEQWFLADNATSDKRFDPQNTISRNSDGSWKMRNSKVRMSVFTSTGYSVQDSDLRPRRAGQPGLHAGGERLAEHRDDWLREGQLGVRRVGQLRVVRARRQAQRQPLGVRGQQLQGFAAL
ncbi:discoidin domain-containing protein [Myxococcus xanthus]|uniref:discoidin domain-containing protein n=1 Tax=Myxococcus xanthus TaxID=34 RepID=UPI003AB1EF7D